MTTQNIAEGRRVRLRHDVSRFPHFIVDKGAEGVVVDIHPDWVRVLMDKHIPGAEDWDNELIWFDDMNILDDVVVL